MDQKNKKCSSCKCTLLLKYYKIKRNGMQYKTCLKCSENRKKYKCDHNKRRYECKACGGDSICEHKKIRSRCTACMGGSICDHKKIRSRCKACMGGSRCSHNKMRETCKRCNDPIKVTINAMYRSSKQSDKKKNRYDADHFIDKSFLIELINEYKEEHEMRCSYCELTMQFLNYEDTLCTIERKNNEIGHIKSNVILCCKKCNITRVGQK